MGIRVTYCGSRVVLVTISGGKDVTDPSQEEGHRSNKHLRIKGIDRFGSSSSLCSLRRHIFCCSLYSQRKRKTKRETEGLEAATTRWALHGDEPRFPTELLRVLARHPSRQGCRFNRDRGLGLRVFPLARSRDGRKDFGSLEILRTKRKGEI